MLPALSPEGLLPPGIYIATLPEIRATFAGNQPRLQIFAGLGRAASALQLAGCRRLWVDGSFVTSKPVPGDWDGCWDPAGVDPQQLDPQFIDFSPQGRARIKVKYMADLFPSSWIEASKSRSFLDYFQVDKTTGLPKGVIQLNLGGTP